MLSPNKQNLLYLQRQTKLLANGLRLLTEKRNSLILVFLDLSRKGKQMEIEVSSEWKYFFINYLQDFALVNIKKLKLKLVPVLNSKIRITQKRLSGVYIQDFEFDVEKRSHPNLKIGVNNSLNEFRRVFPKFVQLAQVKNNCLKISQQIIKTNRQISNLENKIQETNFQVKNMSNVLSEKANAEKAILIKIFN